QNGDVTSLLQNSDGNIVELNPQEWVDLIFTAPPLSEGMKRTFIFVSRGRYERVPEEKQETQTLIMKSGMDETTKSEKLKYELYENRPNPFNPITKIKYSIPEPAYVSLKIYDVLGREISVIVNDWKEVGTHEVEWNAQSFSSGVYFYKLQAGAFTSVKKMLLAK
ncbi:MAG: T9SS type A sorting domain-containing protein, partial [Bacteroidota bacterium]|nr:T9SS type A sorting domain-containing protein [Bacteroidota bacterium]